MQPDLLFRTHNGFASGRRPAPPDTALELSLIVPCYNEEAMLPLALPRLRALLSGLEARGLVSPQSSVVFVDDGSRDATWAMIEQASLADRRVRGVKLSRNRGHQNALLAGLLCSSADVTISLDADLQDDLEAIPRMLQAHLRGAEIVYGVRRRRDKDTWFKRTSARGYYAALRMLGVDIVADHADFRLMSRRALDALRGFREVNLFLRGIVPMLGFPTAVVHYDRAARAAGESKYPLRKMIALGLEGVFSFSTVPLRWITWLGLSVSAASIAFAAWAVGVRLFTDHAVPGWASTVVPMYFLGGVQLLALGVIGGYLSRVYAETKRRPRFIVAKSL
jgi:glycosyltransferase involved in cell wall biosynthesis